MVTSKHALIVILMLGSCAHSPSSQERENSGSDVPPAFPKPPALVIGGPSPSVSAVTANSVVTGSASRAVSYVPDWNEVAFLEDGWIQSWNAEGYTKRFDLTFLGAPSQVDRIRDWSVSNNGLAFAVVFQGQLYTSQEANKIQRVPVRIEDKSLLQLTPSGLGVGSCIAISPNGTRLLVSMASAVRFEENTSRAPLHDAYVIDLESGHGTLLRSGSLPSWLDDQLVILLELQPDENYSLPSLVVVNVISGDVLFHLADVHGYSLVEDGFAVFKDDGVSIRAFVYNLSFKLNAELTFLRPSFGGMNWKKYALVLR